MAVFSGSEPALKLCRPHSMTATATRAGSNTERTKLAAPSERAINKTAEGQAQPKKNNRDAAKRGGLPCAATFLSRYRHQPNVPTMRQKASRLSMSSTRSQGRSTDSTVAFTTATKPSGTSRRVVIRAARKNQSNALGNRCRIRGSSQSPSQCHATNSAKTVAWTIAPQSPGTTGSPTIKGPYGVAASSAVQGIQDIAPPKAKIHPHDFPHIQFT